MNEVKIDWSKFKGRGSGKILERGKQSYIELCELLHKNNHTLLSDYISARDKILINYNCGHDNHWASPISYKQGKVCPECSKAKAVEVGIKGGIKSFNSRLEEVECDFEIDWTKFKVKDGLSESNYKITKNNYLKFLNELDSRGDTLIGDFVNNKTTTTIQLKCGHERRVTPSQYNKGCKCRICEGVVAKQKKRAEEDLKQFIENNGHKLLSEYVDSGSKILIDYNCGHDPIWLEIPTYKNNLECKLCLKERVYKEKQDKLISFINQNGHKLLSEYVDDRTKVLIDYGCGHDPGWVVPNTYYENSECVKCVNLKKFKNRVYKYANSNSHTVLSEIIDTETEVLIDYGCGHDPSLIPAGKYVSGAVCPKCKEEKRHVVINEFMELVNNNGHKLLSEYINSNTKVLIDFNCGHEPHWITPRNYKQGKGCPICVGQSPEQNKKGLIELINKNGHKLLSEYINNSTKVLIDFNCGHEPHWITPVHYRNGYGCPLCYGKSGQARIDFVNTLKENGHKLLSEYINTQSKALIDFNCGHEPHWIRVSDYKSGKGCPLCKNKGEGALHKLLVDMGYEVHTQKKYKDLKDRGILSYDFYLPEYNLLIELDGDHHRKQVKYTSKDMTELEKDMAKLDAEIRFYDRQRKDRLKDEYARDNNIPLLRIEYNNGKIELDEWKEIILDEIIRLELNNIA